MVSLLIKSQNQRYIVNEIPCNDHECIAKLYSILDDNVQFISNLEVKCSLGNRRLSVSNDGQNMVTSIYEKRVYYYNVTTRNIVWEKKTKEFIDAVIIKDDKIYLIYVSGNVEVLDFEGNFLFCDKKIETLESDDYGELLLVEDSYIHMGAKKLKPINSKYLSSIKVCDTVVLSEIRGRIVCYSPNGICMWEYENDSNSQFIRLAYSFDLNIIIAISVNYMDTREKTRVHLINVQGERIQVKEINRGELEFVSANNIIVNSKIESYKVKELLCDK